MDSQKTARFIDTLWDNDIVPTLTDYIRIPNKPRLSIRSGSRMATWTRSSRCSRAGRGRSSKSLPGATLEVVRLQAARR